MLEKYRWLVLVWFLSDDLVEINWKKKFGPKNNELINYLKLQDNSFSCVNLMWFFLFNCFDSRCTFFCITISIVITDILLIKLNHFHRSTSRGHRGKSVFDRGEGCETRYIQRRRLEQVRNDKKFLYDGNG